MPELPEVETVLRGLKARVVGRWLSTAEVHHPQIIVGSPDDFVEEVRGRKILSAQRKGKAIALELGPRRGNGRGDSHRYLLVRLGMTGKFTVNATASPLESHTHVQLGLDDGREEIRYRDARRFGRLRCLTRDELDVVLGSMGPDAPEISEEQFLNGLRGRRVALKSWLMNQQVVAGVGNIYADEALFLARLHPLTEAGRISVPEARRLLRAVKEVLARAVALQGTTFRDYIDVEGRPGKFRRKLRVYHRTGKPCVRCRQPIERLIIGGRSSHFCPHCQPRLWRKSVRAKGTKRTISRRAPKRAAKRG